MKLDTSRPVLPEEIPCDKIGNRARKDGSQGANEKSVGHNHDPPTLLRLERNISPY